MVEIIDDCIPKEDQDRIEALCKSHSLVSGEGKVLEQIHWFYNVTANYSSVQKDEDMYPGNRSLKKLGYSDPPQLTYTVFEEPDETPHAEYFIKLFLPLLSKISVDLFRMKLNLNFPLRGYPENTITGPHVDFIKDKEQMAGLWTGVYYINDSDGDTILFEEVYDENTTYDKLTIKQRISPKKGRMVLFPAETIHAASLPSTGERMVLNINYRSGEVKQKMKETL